MAQEISPLNDGDEFSPMAAINVTPFVDVTLVLLVIFMITAPIILKDAIKVQLPKVVKVDAKASQVLGITITKAGQFFLNGIPIEPEALSEAAIEAKRTQPDAQAVISADIEALHGNVVKAIDIIKTAGLTNFAIEIEHR